MNKKKRLWILIGCVILLAAAAFLLLPDNEPLPEDGTALPESQIEEPAGPEELPPAVAELPEDPEEPEEPEEPETPQEPEAIAEDGWYSAPEDVTLYLRTYGHLPGNFLTKDEARDLGWNAKEGNLWEVAEGMSIGGDRFGNREGLLPQKRGRQWYECDVNYEGGFRGPERILFSDDGLIYYTDDHYESFTEMQ